MTSEDHRGEGPSSDVAGPRWVKVEEPLTVDDKSAVHLDIERYGVCVVRSLGEIHAIRDECTHGQVPLSEGDVESGYVECWLHGSRFDLTTGAPTGPPATEPVAVYPVRTSGDDIEVCLPAAED